MTIIFLATLTLITKVFHAKWSSVLCTGLFFNTNNLPADYLILKKELQKKVVPIPYLQLINLN